MSEGHGIISPNISLYFPRQVCDTPYLNEFSASPLGADVTMQILFQKSPEKMNL